ncbi:tetratricopeptide repeat protein [Tamlana haliotis]|uniref:Tetratricopeptide repeat protein n=1 Tax=Pseudotamlana haliotis TaxID=2614804 RepID=A0A6N6MFC2_9FLAO|nr:tetratricopeptide repeat protein [Tamlana haliotis]KAB1067489.1 tetratricopeptide repeat protein [Tamlana haliotis]
MSKILLFVLLPCLGFSQGNFAEVDALFQEKQYHDAELFLTKYLKNHPNNLEVKSLLGDAYGYQKKWDNAINCYEEVLEKDKTKAKYFYNYGSILAMMAMENRLKAMAYIGDMKVAFLKAAELDKKHINTRWALVQYYMHLPGIVGGSKEKALQYAQELEQLSKVDGYLAKGFIYKYDDDFEEAEIYYKKAVKVGGSLTCYLELMKLYEQENLHEKALETVEIAKQHLQDNALNYQLGRLSASYQIAHKKGITSLENYLKKFSDKDQIPKASAHYRLAQIYRYQEHKNQALKHINLALKELPSEERFSDEKEHILDM